MDDETLSVKDSNGTLLANGDNVTVIKDLKVKGTSTVLKRGTVARNIKLVNEEEVEYGSGRNTMVLRTEFIKKASA